MRSLFLFKVSIFSYTQRRKQFRVSKWNGNFVNNYNIHYIFHITITYHCLLRHQTDGSLSSDHINFRVNFCHCKSANIFNNVWEDLFNLFNITCYCQPIFTDFWCTNYWIYCTFPHFHNIICSFPMQHQCGFTGWEQK